MKRLWLIFFVIPIFAQETEKDDSFYSEDGSQSTGSMAIGLYRCRNHGITSGPS